MNIQNTFTIWYIATTTWILSRGALYPFITHEVTNIFQYYIPICSNPRIYTPATAKIPCNTSNDSLRVQQQQHHRDFLFSGKTRITLHLLPARELCYFSRGVLNTYVLHSHRLSPLSVSSREQLLWENGVTYICTHKSIVSFAYGLYDKWCSRSLLRIESRFSRECSFTPRGFTWYVYICEDVEDFFFCVKDWSGTRVYIGMVGIKISCWYSLQNSVGIDQVLLRKVCNRWIFLASQARERRVPR